MIEFWQTKSQAIIVQDPVPAECIYKVISQNGDRILFERHSTPRPAPKVTLKSSWQSQQQHVTDQTGIRDVRGHTTDDQTSTRKVVRNFESLVDKKPQFEIDLRIEGVSQDAILQGEAKMDEMVSCAESIRNDLSKCKNDLQ